MDITAAFTDLQRAADADKDAVAAARSRRDSFRAALRTDTDILEVVPSGSLARSTQRDPINDVDVIVVFDEDEHADWGVDGDDSAYAALDHLQGRIKALLGTADGTVEKIVRRADRKNHAVKSFLDDPNDLKGFTVDAMPALRRDGTQLLVPEQFDDKWILTDPEDLIARVAARQSDWDRFRPLVRVLKYWNSQKGRPMKSLTVEVLALHHLVAADTRPKALQKFFQAAANAVLSGVHDPAGLCGEIQPDLDRWATRNLLDEAAGLAWRAVNAQDAGDSDRAGCLWRGVFGDAFPEPPGGCDEDDDESSRAAFNIGTGAAATGIGVDRSHSILDAPQG